MRTEKPGKVHLLDLRSLSPPEPMERILEALEQLESDTTLEALTPFYPQPLFVLLESAGVIWEAEAKDDGTARLFLWRPRAQSGQTP